MGGHGSLNRCFPTAGASPLRVTPSSTSGGGGGGAVRARGREGGVGGALEYIRTLHMKVTSFQPGEIRGASAER